MLKYLANITVVLFIILSPVLSALSYSATIFSDDFNSHPDTCHTGGTVPSGWDSWYQQNGEISATFDSVTHYAGEISSPGRGGTGKSLKTWRHYGWPSLNNYTGSLGYIFNANYSNIYIRYYQKIPIALTLNASDYLKSWRFNTTGGSGEIYLNFRVGNISGDMRTLGTLGIYDGAGWTTVLDNDGLRAIWDGDWHCIEFQLGLDNSTLRLWVDGVSKYNNTSYHWSASGYFDFIQHFAIGNVGDGSSWQNSWQAIEFDDVVISTTYVGPGDFVPSPDPTPSPSTSSSSGGGGCFIATAAFGSAAEPTVKILKEFRDKILMANDLGSSLVFYYERTSPPIADYIRRYDSAKYFVRICLLPLAGLCWLSLAIGPFNTLILGIFLVALIAKRRTVLNVLRSSI